MKHEGDRYNYVTLILCNKHDIFYAVVRQLE